jgi:hypothetical protein
LATSACALRRRALASNLQGRSASRRVRRQVNMAQDRVAMARRSACGVLQRHESTFVKPYRIRPVCGVPTPSRGTTQARAALSTWHASERGDRPARQTPARCRRECAAFRPAG